MRQRPEYAKKARDAGFTDPATLAFLQLAEMLEPIHLARAIMFLDGETLAEAGLLTAEQAADSARKAASSDVVQDPLSVAGFKVVQDPQAAAGFSLVSEPAAAASPLPAVMRPNNDQPSFICPDRIAQGRAVWGGPQDGWRVHPNGDKTCTWCGSMSPEGFAAILCEAADVSKQTRIEMSLKSYKVYIHRPAVPNAAGGAIKFYTWHLPPDGTDERRSIDELWNQAHESSQRKFASIYLPAVPKPTTHMVRGGTVEQLDAR